MTDETTHRERAQLGEPLVRGWLYLPPRADPQGGPPGPRKRIEVAYWAPPVEEWESGTWRGWMFLESHAEYDPPRRVLGSTPFQVIVIAFDFIHRFIEQNDAQYAVYGETEP